MDTSKIDRQTGKQTMRGAVRDIEIMNKIMKEKKVDPSVQLLIEEYEQLIDWQETMEGVSGVDRSLLRLLKKFGNELCGVDVDYMQGFQKQFRQVDTIDDGDGTLDYVMWHLMGESKIFWTAMDKTENKLKEK